MAIESVGARLKKLRLEKGLSIEEVHKRTKIHLNVLKAIEEDRLAGISPVYLKGFLKIYCGFLGIASGEFVPEYKEPIKGVATKTAPRPAPVKAAATTFTIPRLNIGSLNPSVRLVIRRIAVGAAALLVLVVLFNLGRKLILSIRAGHRGRTAAVHAPVIHRQNKPATAPKTKPVVASEPVQPAASATPVTPEAAAGVRLGVRAKEDCYLQLKSDGKVVFQGVLKRGRLETWIAKEKMELSLGNAAAVEIEANGKFFANLGRRGQALKNIVITREGLRIGR